MSLTLSVGWSRRMTDQTTDETPYVIIPFFAAVRGSVRARTPPRRSDKVRNTGNATFQQQQNYPSRSVLYGSEKAGVTTKDHD